MVIFKESLVKNPAQVASEMAQACGFEIMHIYENTLSGFSAQIPDSALDAIGFDPRVDYIEEDAMGQIVE